MTPEESKKMIADWIANNPEKGAELEKIARENTNKFLEERKVLRETDHNAYMKLISNEPSASRDPELYYDKQLRNLVRNEERARRIAAMEAERAAKLAARGK